MADTLIVVGSNLRLMNYKIVASPSFESGIGLSLLGSSGSFSGLFRTRICPGIRFLRLCFGIFRTRQEKNCFLLPEILSANWKLFCSRENLETVVLLTFAGSYLYWPQHDTIQYDTRRDDTSETQDEDKHLRKANKNIWTPVFFVRKHWRWQNLTRRTHPPLLVHWANF